MLRESCLRGKSLFDDVSDAQGPGRATLIQAFKPPRFEALGLHHFHCDGAPDLAGLSDRHTIILNRSSFVGIACTIGRSDLNHTAMAGNVTLIPADTEWTATADGPLDNIVVSIPRSSFAAAAARADRPSLTIAPQIRGRDDALQAIVNEMIEGSISATEPGASWYDLTTELIDHVANLYSIGVKGRKREILTTDEMERINMYLAPRLAQTVWVDELADVVAQSASHFPRVFRRTVGLSPYQYIVRLRLRRARDLIRAGLPLAEAALDSGFVDQSHLSSWVRRIYGTTLRCWGERRG